MYLPDLDAEPGRRRKTSGSGERYRSQRVSGGGRAAWLAGRVPWPWPSRCALPSHACIFGERSLPSVGEGERHGMSAGLSGRFTP